ncbi:ribonuclease 3 [Aliidongia dinghuensis]|uniref:Ribonuclease 3 n=1 Tax=Aliidongia dinghuensis TaxID=1867774 RepID=A0A8J2YZM8_9PROT|nr:ribonuclease III [Aliidongia dinghuensis]GGF41018.1 ribonuclease 3 [Aliidongia dinghuensis]
MSDAVTAPGQRSALEGELGHRFVDAGLLEEALTHRSAAYVAAGRRDRRGARRSLGYERLEFLGDRVLGLLVAEMLMAAFPREAEGALARRHADLVRKETLAAVATDIDLADHVRLPALDDGAARHNPSLLADVCEAVIAALYVDGGLEAARRFVVERWTPRMNASLTPPKDPKTALQEWAQGRGRPLPVYRLVKTDGPPHQPVFTVSASVEGEAEEVASGASKRLAEAAAAAILLARISGSAKGGTP